MTTRTMLPPNLTRHYWDARRALLQASGRDIDPWYRLTPGTRAVAEAEMELFRQAVRAAEAEQDLLAALDDTAATPGQQTAAAHTPAGEPATTVESTSEECSCSGCSAVATLMKLTGAPADVLERSVGWQILSSGHAPGPVAFRAVPIEGGAPTPEELERLRTNVVEAITQWVAGGQPLKVVPPPPTFTGISVSHGALAYTYDDLKRDMAMVKHFTGSGGM
ncbi:hypothetical protein ACFQ6U_13960 [Streptomyces sp. NPDC056465]|uniref:hypothetical protein n=1 Tax=unclassified Streptomyces TaxID=2593676 RepID=UPI0035DD5956